MTAPTLFLPQDPPAQTTATGETVQADGAGPAGELQPRPNPFASWMPILVVVLIFWVIVIAPQGRERKKRAAMLAAVAKDDEVMTTGGMYGRVAKVDGDAITLIVADGVRMRFHRQAIQTVLSDSKTSDEPPKEAAR